MSIPLLDLKKEYLTLKSEIDDAINTCLSEQQWILGAQVDIFEEAVAKLLGAENCIGTSSGTEALVLALRALAIVRKGEEFFSREDKFLVPALTFAATGEAVLRAGGTPVIIDVSPETFNIDTFCVQECLAVTSGVVGILPVHLYGYPADMQSVMRLATQHELCVVEDVAQAFGGVHAGKPLGSIGDIGAMSFFPSKLLGAYGDAGMMMTNHPEIARVLRMLIRHGGEDKYNVTHVGYNARLDTIQAAILGVKLKYLNSNLARRRTIAQYYRSEFSGMESLTLPSDKDGLHQYHQFTLTLAAQEPRDELQNRLTAQGISSAVYYPVPLHQMDLFKRLGTTYGDLSTAEQLCKKVLSIPIDPYMTDDACETVVRTIRKSCV